MPANFNSNDQIAISGDYETVEKALPVAKELGAKARDPVCRSVVRFIRP